VAARTPNGKKDPTENVQALSEAANKRQDDLREANNRLTESEIKRVDERITHADKMAELRERHFQKMRTAETARLDSIRQVDVTAVRTEADRALAAIQTLAATTATNAENLRNALTTTAATIAKQTADSFTQVIERIAALEKSSYEGVGKQRLADPQMIDLLAEVKALRESGAGRAGVSQGIDKTWAVICAVAAIAISATVGYVAVNHAPPPAAPPQVIYAPPPVPPPR
jgi:hypothetical protein